MTTKPRVVVVGAGFAGIAAAREVRARLPDSPVVLISDDDEIVHTPSLIWVPFGLRDRRAISALVRPLLAGAGIQFRHAPVMQVDLSARRVVTPLGSEAFDHLILATGARSRLERLEGRGPEGGVAASLCSWSEASAARLALERVFDDPGPIVVGAAPGAACIDTAYEFLFALAHHLRRRELDARVRISFVTPEPFLGHIGRGDEGNRDALERLLARLGIEVIVGARIARATGGAVDLEGGGELPCRFALVLPPRGGIRALEGGPLVDGRGLVVTDRHGQSPFEPSVYAAGSASAFRQPDGWAVCGEPSGGHLAEADARIVAANVAATILDRPIASFEDEAAVVARLRAGPSASELHEVGTVPARELRWRLPGPEARWALDSQARYFAGGPRPP